MKDLRELARMYDIEGIYLMRRHTLIEAIQEKEDEMRSYKADAKECLERIHSLRLKKLARKNGWTL